MTDQPEILTHPLLDVAGVRHGFFTRRGGASKDLYAGLNVGLGSGDDPDAVIENRRRAAAAFGLEAEALITCHQTHSAIARVAEAPWGELHGERRPEGDAIVTVRPDLMCGVLTADCAPILLADPAARVVGAAHAGWKGALTGIVESVVHAMIAAGAESRRIVAVVGPCIGPDSYEVGADFEDRFEHHDPGAARFFRPGETEDKRWFDLPAYVLWKLEREGVGEAAWIGRDTLTDAEAFYSNRRAFKRREADYGRLLSAIALT